MRSQCLQTNYGSGQGRDRTGDTRIFSPLLYQLSYLAFAVPKSFKPTMPRNVTQWVAHALREPESAGKGRLCSASGQPGLGPVQHAKLKCYLYSAFVSTTPIHPLLFPTQHRLAPAVQSLQSPASFFRKTPKWQQTPLKVIGNQVARHGYFQPTFECRPPNQRVANDVLAGGWAESHSQQAGSTQATPTTLTAALRCLAAKGTGKFKRIALRSGVNRQPD